MADRCSEEPATSAQGALAPYDLVREDPGTRLYAWRTAKFKTLTLRLVFCEPLDEHAALRALAAAVLRRGCRRLPSLSDFRRELERLYGAQCSVHVQKFGERQITQAQVRVPDTRLVDPSDRSFARAVELLGEVLLDPIAEQGGFGAKVFEQEREQLLRAIRSLKDDKILWAQHRFVRHMFEGEPYARLEWGEEDEVRRADRTAALELHRKRLSSAPLAAFLVGAWTDEDRAAVDALIDRLGKRDHVSHPPAEIQRDPPTPPREVVEREAVAQTKLHVGYRMATRGLDDRRYVAVGLYNAMLGGASGLSRLFKEVREKRSLAYYANSSADRVKGFLSLSAGVSADKWREAADVMKEQVEVMRSGRFEEKELEVARAVLLSSLDGVHDAPGRSIDFVQSAFLAGRPGDARRISEVLTSLGGAEVQDVAALPREDLTYVLEGVTGDAP